MFDNAILLNTQIAVSVPLPSCPPLVVSPMLGEHGFPLDGATSVSTHIDMFPDHQVVALTIAEPGARSLCFLLDALAPSTADLLRLAAKSNCFLVGTNTPPGNDGIAISEGITDICSPALQWVLEQMAKHQTHSPKSFVSRALSLDLMVRLQMSTQGENSGGREPGPLQLNVLLGPEHGTPDEAAAAGLRLVH